MTDAEPDSEERVAQYVAERRSRRSSGLPADPANDTPIDALRRHMHERTGR